jgi:hypothetical protein
MNKYQSTILAVALSLSAIGSANAEIYKLDNGRWRVVCDNGKAFQMGGGFPIRKVGSVADKICGKGNYTFGREPAVGATSDASTASQDNASLSSSLTESGATRAIPAKR